MSHIFSTIKNHIFFKKTGSFYIHQIYRGKFRDKQLRNYACIKHLLWKKIKSGAAIICSEESHANYCVLLALQLVYLNAVRNQKV